MDYTVHFSPGQSTGVGSHSLFQGILPNQGLNPGCLRESESLLVVSYSFRPHGLYCLWNTPGQIAGVGSSSLLQGIFPTQGLNPGLPHCRQILYQLSHHGSLSMCGETLNQALPVKSVSEDCFAVKAILPMLL